MSQASRPCIHQVCPVVDHRTLLCTPGPLAYPCASGLPLQGPGALVAGLPPGERRCIRQRAPCSRRRHPLLIRQRWPNARQLLCGLCALPDGPQAATEPASTGGKQAVCLWQLVLLRRRKLPCFQACRLCALPDAAQAAREPAPAGGEQAQTRLSSQAVVPLVFPGSVWPFLAACLVRQRGSYRSQEVLLSVVWLGQRTHTEDLPLAWSESRSPHDPARPLRAQMRQLFQSHGFCAARARLVPSVPST